MADRQALSEWTPSDPGFWDGVDPSDRSDAEFIEEFVHVFGFLPEDSKALLERFPAIAAFEDEDAYDAFHSAIKTLEQVDTVEYIVELTFELVERGVFETAVERTKEQKGNG